ncbi:MULTISPECIES: universal stress protein [unclassified Nocardioides]|uniref:universal stress protein n=1 Tax=unclassified Nocardioides TaxID=2615069 RepID=UPI00360CAB02
MTILLGYKPNALGDAALERAIDEARRHEDRLVVLNVARGDAAIENNRLTDPQAEGLQHRLTESGVEFEIERLVDPGEVAEEVLEAADRLGADLIVIGLRHRTAVGKLILGSDAQRILMHATCPVLAVKPLL